MKRVLMYTAIIAAFLSCSEAENSNETSKSKKITLTTQAQDMSRVSLNDVDLSWNDDDQLSVVTINTASRPAVFTTTAEYNGESEAQFSGTLSADATDGNIYATFPKGGSYKVANEEIVATFTQSQSQVQNHLEYGDIDAKSSGANLMLYGKSTEPLTSKGESYTMPLNNLAAIQDWNFVDLPSDKSITKFEVVNSLLFLGSVDVMMDSKTINEGYKSIQSLSVALENNQPFAERTVRVAILPQTIAAGAELQIALTFSDGTISKMKRTLESDIVYEAGVCYGADQTISYNDFKTAVPDPIMFTFEDETFVTPPTTLGNYIRAFAGGYTTFGAWVGMDPNRTSALSTNSGVKVCWDDRGTIWSGSISSDIPDEFKYVGTSIMQIGWDCRMLIKLPPTFNIIKKLQFVARNSGNVGSSTDEAKYVIPARREFTFEISTDKGATWSKFGNSAILTANNIDNALLHTISATEPVKINEGEEIWLHCGFAYPGMARPAEATGTQEHVYVFIFDNLKISAE